MDATPPHSPHAEEALIGAAIIDPGVLQAVDVQAEDFYIHRNRAVWAALVDLSGRGVNPDFVTLGDYLHSHNQLEEVGGVARLAALINDTPSSLGAEDYAGIVKEKSIRRRMIQVATDIAKAAYSDGSDLNDARAQAITSLVSAAVPTGGAVHISHYLGKVYDEVVAMADNPCEVWGIPTGLEDFDFITGGLQRGEVMLLSGEPGKGKTKLAGQMAVNMARDGHPGGFYSLEMAGEAVTRRMVSAAARVETRKLKSGRMDEQDWRSLNDMIEQMEQYPIYLSDASHWRTDSLRADLSRLKRLYEIEWFVVDYLNLMMDGSGKLDDTERSKIISRQMKAICKDLELAGIVIQSMNKSGMDSAVPTLRNLSGASQVAFDADIVTFLVDHIPDPNEAQNPDLRTLVFGKGRELANPRQAFHLFAHNGYPAFGDVQLEKVELNFGGKNGKSKR